METKQAHNLRFDRGATHLVVGPSASGKTFRTCNILANKDTLIEGGDQIKNVVFFYSVWQDIYQEMKDRGVVTKFINKKPSVEEFVKQVGEYKDKGGSIVVIGRKKKYIYCGEIREKNFLYGNRSFSDDFMGNIDEDMVSIVTVHSRHYLTSTFLLFQSLFPANRLARQISLNVKFIHCHKNPRENAQFQVLARQLMPKDWRWLVEVYHEVSKIPHGCLLIDMTQKRNEVLRFRSNYLPHEFPMRVWYSKNDENVMQELM